MADLLNSMVPLVFGIADGAAAPSTPVALIPAGMPDAADVATYVMPKTGAVVGMLLNSKPTQSGDNVSVQVYKNGAAVTGGVLANSFAIPGASLILSKDTPALQFTTGDLIGVRYTTVTGGTYGVNDIQAVVLAQLGLSE
ncbi:MAG TPA: hypothetical protein VK821_05910 [Dehalococcoidia bacterium]|nr:hypothetical protein [Dehalococcoidia bacterium]